MVSSFWQTAKNELISIKSLSRVLIIAFIYFSFSVLILNYRFITASIFGNYPLYYKIKDIYELMIGSYYAFSPLDFYLLVLSSFLVGLNLLIVLKVIKELREDKGKLSFVVGGSSLIGFTVAGCTSCGFSVLSLLGLGGALYFIPFGGLGLQLITIALLTVSFIYSLRTFHYKIVCNTK